MLLRAFGVLCRKCRDFGHAASDQGSSPGILHGTANSTSHLFASGFVQIAISYDVGGVNYFWAEGGLRHPISAPFASAKLRSAFVCRDYACDGLWLHVFTRAAETCSFRQAGARRRLASG